MVKYSAATQFLKLQSQQLHAKMHAVFQVESEGCSIRSGYTRKRVFMCLQQRLLGNFIFIVIRFRRSTTKLARQSKMLSSKTVRFRKAILLK